MKTTYSAIILLLLSISPSFAYETATMRDLTVQSMTQYAQALYDRGDYREAKNVMVRIKALNPDYGKAKPKNRVAEAVTVKACCETPVHTQTKIIEVTRVLIDPNADLRQAIAQEDQIITSLNHDVDTLRTDIQATHHE